MPTINDEGTPLIELTSITDFYADGIHRFEVLGANIRVIYFKWRYLDGIWQRVCADFARVMPAEALRVPLERWTDVKIVRGPLAEPMVSH